MKILVALALVQIVFKMSSCSPTMYVISSYSKVRLQQPTSGLSVESQMPMDIMLNPILADEPPTQIDKMESIFIKSDQIKNVKSMNIDEKEIMDSMNNQNISTTVVNEEANVYDDKDFISFGQEKPVGFTVKSVSTEAEN